MQRKQRTWQVLWVSILTYTQPARNYIPYKWSIPQLNLWKDSLTKNVIYEVIIEYFYISIDIGTVSPPMSKHWESNTF